MTHKYVVSKDIEMLAPEWLASRIEVKGVRVGDEVARIGDTIVFDGRRLSVERR